MKSTGFQLLLIILIDAQVHGEYVKMLNKFLVKAMEARMEG